MGSPVTVRTIPSTRAVCAARGSVNIAKRITERSTTSILELPEQESYDLKDTCCRPADSGSLPASGEYAANLHDKTVPHYRITEQLGGGGMGVGYKAEDTKVRHDRNAGLRFC